MVATAAAAAACMIAAAAHIAEDPFAPIVGRVVVQYATELVVAVTGLVSVVLVVAVAVAVVVVLVLVVTRGSPNLAP